ncbi:MAG: peptidase and subtilisin, kexin, sedolisin [Acidobacteria bacterium]|nr:peptidase and subtilisin, kexin, sedolisin [Acidobacteriota bacterium]
MKEMGSKLLGRAAGILGILGVLVFQGDLGAQGQVRHYIVMLREQSVAVHLARRRAALPLTVQPDDLDADSHRARLRAQQAALKRRIESKPQGRVRAQMETVFNGIVVTLREEDVASVQNLPEVEEVFPSLSYQKMLDAALPLADVPQAWANPGIGGEPNAGAGIRIAVIDSGIDVTHPMFQDASLTSPSGFPRFTASTSDCFNNDQQYTNSKVIVARNYVALLDSPDPNCDAQDRDGHGTFVAGIAAGRRVSAPLASLAGVAPKAFLGSYKVFGTPGTNDNASGAAIVKAIDDAVRDGMHVINLSLGAPTNNPPTRDPLALALAGAVEMGVTVVVAAGNEGPGTGTIASPGISPAAITVGATTSSRFFANPLTLTAPTPPPPELATIGALLGNGPRLTATAGPAQLVDVQRLDSTGAACSPLPAETLLGRMALIRRGECNFSTKIRNAFAAGAIAAILYNNLPGQPPILMDVESATQIPSAMIGNSEGVALKQFLAASGGIVQASLGAERRAIPTRPNEVTDFSSRGPSTDFGIKPDLSATGNSLYSAFQRNDPAGAQFDASGFGFASGTSFSAPLVAGAAALVKQVFPQFTPAQVKSALVSTAAKVVSDPSGKPPSILSHGNGVLAAAAALSTPATVSPVSISFGARQPGTLLNSTNNLTVTNVATITDSFRVSVTGLQGTAGVTVTVSPADFVLGGGETRTLAVTATSSEPLNGTIEGYLFIQSQTTQRTITVPYWGTFLLPQVSPGGTVNAASIAVGPSTVAAGSLVSIFGTHLANETAGAVTLPLPKSLGGVRVLMDDTVLPLLSVSPLQINAQVPVELSGRGFTTLTVRLNGVTSGSMTVPLSPAAPGIFTVNHSGSGQGAVVHASDFSLVTAQRPARGGEFLAVFATGLGATTPSVSSGSPASSSTLAVTQITPTATIAGMAAPVRFSGMAPGFVGLYQVNLEVPAGVPGGQQTLILTSNGINSNSVTIAIGP